MTAEATGDLTQADAIFAHHEAGHAVAAWVMKVPVISLHLGKDAGYSQDGLRRRNLDPTTMDRGGWKYVKSKALILLAGEYAERAWHETQGTYPDEWGFASHHDRVALDELLSNAHGDCIPEVGYSLSDLERDTEGLIANHWRHIRALASRLLIQHRLSGDEAKEIIESA